MVALEWYEKQRPGWTESTSYNIMRRLERELLAPFGTRPIKTVDPKMILEAIAKIDDRDCHETARRALQCCGQIFRYAVPRTTWWAPPHPIQLCHNHSKKTVQSVALPLQSTVLACLTQANPYGGDCPVPDQSQRPARANGTTAGADFGRDILTWNQSTIKQLPAQKTPLE